MSKKLIKIESNLHYANMSWLVGSIVFFYLHVDDHEAMENEA